MAPQAGTLRVGRYFLALVALLVALYAIVGFGSRHSPKLGLDLVGGVRVIFTAQTPKGSPPPTTDQMTQARQILEDRINSTGVTGATVVVQGSDQLVVEIPNGTSTDVARLGKAAILNFRPVIAPAQVVACTKATSGSSASASSSAGAAPSPSSSAGAAGAPGGVGPSHSGADAAVRALAAPSKSITAASPAKTSAAKATPAKSSAAGSSAAASASSSPGAPASTPSASPSSTAPPPPCSADPFSALVASTQWRSAANSKFSWTAKQLPNAESCPAPAAVIPQASCRGYADLGATQQQLLTSALQRVDCAATQTEPDIVDRYYFACDRTGQVAYFLGHVIVPGRLIASASAQAPNVSQGQTDWTVSLNLSSAGGNRWNAWTSKYHTDQTSAGNVSPTSCGPSASLPCSDFVGFTLDGQVISAPVTEAILDQRTSISGNFTQTSSNELARELNYGKLPVSFRADAVQNTSPTLGRSQLHAAFLAGGIGLLLVVLYSLIYYRALGLVTIASLLVSATLTYAMLVVLGKQLGYTLDLAGIAGFIVALGITADSFVVFFERLKDEVHEGRSPRVAVPRAWVRARRTILSADTVSFLAAAILYYFASADVKGFAFTLGMSTILDLVVVFLFTHPMVSLLSRSRTFSSARFTGLAAVRGPGPRASEPTAAAAAAAGGPAAPARGGGATSVAVLERPDDVPSEDGSQDLTESGGPRVRNRTAPEPGSAAERAAARRARLRQQRDQDGGR